MYVIAFKDNCEQKEKYNKDKLIRRIFIYEKEQFDINRFIIGESTEEYDRNKNISVALRLSLLHFGKLPAFQHTTILSFLIFVSPLIRRNSRIRNSILNVNTLCVCVSISYLKQVCTKYTLIVILLEIKFEF